MKEIIIKIEQPATTDCSLTLKPGKVIIQVEKIKLNEETIKPIDLDVSKIKPPRLSDATIRALRKRCV